MKAYGGPYFYTMLRSTNIYIHQKKRAETSVKLTSTFKLLEHNRSRIHEVYLEISPPLTVKLFNTFVKFGKWVM